MVEESHIDEWLHVYNNQWWQRFYKRVFIHPIFLEHIVSLGAECDDNSTCRLGWSN